MRQNFTLEEKINQNSLLDGAVGGIYTLVRGIVFLFVAGIVLFLIAVLMSMGDITEADFKRLMVQEAIQNAKPGTSRFGVCGDDDYYQQTFSGVKNGVPVTGVICKGASKAFTIRYF